MNIETEKVAGQSEGEDQQLAKGAAVSHFDESVPPTNLFPFLNASNLLSSSFSLFGETSSTAANVSGPDGTNCNEKSSFEKKSPLESPLKENSSSLTWTANGPPPHWAASKHLNQGMTAGTNDTSGGTGNESIASGDINSFAQEVTSKELFADSNDSNKWDESTEAIASVEREERKADGDGDSTFASTPNAVCVSTQSQEQRVEAKSGDSLKADEVKQCDSVDNIVTPVKAAPPPLDSCTGADSTNLEEENYEIPETNASNSPMLQFVNQSFVGLQGNFMARFRKTASELAELSQAMDEFVGMAPPKPNTETDQTGGEDEAGEWTRGGQDASTLAAERSPQPLEEKGIDPVKVDVNDGLDKTDSHVDDETTIMIALSTQKKVLNQDKSRDEASNNTAKCQFANHSFANVSQVLHDNIIALFREGLVESSSRGVDDRVVTSTEKMSSSVLQPTTGKDLTTCETVNDATKVGDQPIVPKDAPDDSHHGEPIASVNLDVTSPKSPSLSLSQLASDTFDVVKASTDVRSTVGLVSLAGGVAGGVAGLCLAGPAGALLGVKFGRTAGMIGFVVGRSVQVGVVVAGVAAAKYTAQQVHNRLQMEGDKRYLQIGSVTGSKKVLLVRPNVVLDPMWEEICEQARSTAPTSTGNKMFPFFTNNSNRSSDSMAERQDCQSGDSDMVLAGEIPTPDKVLHLVSRILKDESSLPGHVYQCLIQEFKQRYQHQPQFDMTTTTSPTTWMHEKEDETALLVIEEEMGANVQESTLDSRSRRQGAHAVVHHVATTLIDIRPAFASSPTITEWTATAVEGMVFGEIYDLVFEEIVKEEEESDRKLMEKVAAYEKTKAPSNGDQDRGIDESKPLLSALAIQALQSLPLAHSATEKLNICVHFLDCISQQFTSQVIHAQKLGAGDTTADSGHLCADSLLDIVCQHILAAHVPHLNAEVAFLEEFALDEQLLRGKEGYALATLQASTYFLVCDENENRDNDEVYKEGEIIKSAALTAQVVPISPMESNEPTIQQATMISQNAIETNDVITLSPSVSYPLKKEGSSPPNPTETHEFAKNPIEGKEPSPQLLPETISTMATQECTASIGMETKESTPTPVAKPISPEANVTTPSLA